ncbi:hypothetical protein Tfu_2524 [Thermobifida fusca YX]|uniref:Uncharacterized protein n=1 Tax=Thermobifida fusca (strain YX) TaxID=269800 RepID=Q47LW5_THEFY|nr:hypothetical protein Tfu_2524 [Thermobifida fusca YX]
MDVERVARDDPRRQVRVEPFGSVGGEHRVAAAIVDFSDDPVHGLRVGFHHLRCGHPAHTADELHELGGSVGVDDEHAGRVRKLCTGLPGGRDRPDVHAIGHDPGCGSRSGQQQGSRAQHGQGSAQPAQPVRRTVADPAPGPGEEEDREQDERREHQGDQAAAGPRMVGGDGRAQQRGADRPGQHHQRQHPLGSGAQRHPAHQESDAERRQQHRGPADVPADPGQAHLLVSAVGVDRQPFDLLDLPDIDAGGFVAVATLDEQQRAGGNRRHSDDDEDRPRGRQPGRAVQARDAAPPQQKHARGCAAHHDPADEQERIERVREVVQVGAGVSESGHEPVAGPDCQPQPQGGGLPAPGDKQQPHKPHHGQQVAERIDAHQQPQSQAQPRGKSERVPCRPPAPGSSLQRVVGKHEPAEQHDLGDRFAVRGAADPLLGQAHREEEGGQRRPSGTDEPRDESRERQHRESTRDRRCQHKSFQVRGPEPERVHQGGAGEELRPDHVVDLVVGEAVVGERRIVPGDELPLLGDRQETVLGDPRGVLGVGGGVPPDDELLGVVGELHRGKGGGDQDH